MFTQHKYSKIVGTGNWTVFGGSSTAAYLRVYGNALYDPDPQIGGTSAYGYTEMNTIHDEHVVYEAHIKVRLWARSGTIKPQTMWTITTERGANSAVGGYTLPLQEVFDSPYCGPIHMLGASTSSQSQIEFGMTAKTHEVFGLPAANVFQEQEFYAPASQLPPNLWIFTIIGVNLTEDDVSPETWGEIKGLITVTYKAKWVGGERFLPQP